MGGLLVGLVVRLMVGLSIRLVVGLIYGLMYILMDGLNSSQVVDISSGRLFFVRLFYLDYIFFSIKRYALIFIIYMGCTLIYDFKLQFIPVNFSVYSFEYYSMLLYFYFFSC